MSAAGFVYLVSYRIPRHMLFCELPDILLELKRKPFTLILKLYSRPRFMRGFSYSGNPVPREQAARLFYLSKSSDSRNLGTKLS